MQCPFACEQDIFFTNLLIQESEEINWPKCTLFFCLNKKY